VINSTAAEGSLDEIKAKKNSLLAKLVRLDAELKNSNKNQLAKSLGRLCRKCARVSISFIFSKSL
jgi:hypothetical protein